MAAVVNDCPGPWGAGGAVGRKGGARLTFLLHAGAEALLQPAVAALVPLVFVHHALPTESGEGSDGWVQKGQPSHPEAIPALTPSLPAFITGVMLTTRKALWTL